MERGPTHFEIFVRKNPQAAWRLEGASENRAHAVETAENLLKEGKVAAIKVTKEVMDQESGEFRSFTVLTKGAVEVETKKRVKEPNADPPCVTPQDLYSAHSREKIGRLLDDWLRRQNATVFELLHRPDLAESLEASGVELQHAIQKIAVPESQSTGAPLHDLIRAYQKLAEGALERLVAAGRKKLFPDLSSQPLDEVARKLAGAPDRQFILGGAIAKLMADVSGWSAKVDRLLDLVEAMPSDPEPRALCRVVIEQLLSEIMGSRTGLADLLGPELDPGAGLLALTRLVAPNEVEAVMGFEPGLAGLMPQMTGPAARLARMMQVDEFGVLRTVLARRIIGELKGSRRLRPADADGEIAVLRALALVLTASAGRLLSTDEVQAAFLERSKALTAADFVTDLNKDRPTVLAEVQALSRLVENVTGQVNRTRAAEWLISSLDSLRFEREFRSGGADTALNRLSTLAGLDRSVRRVGLGEGDQRHISQRLGDLAGMIEGDTRLIALLLRSPAPLPQKATILLRVASGELCPPGAAADRAKAELVKLLKSPTARAELAQSPDVASRVREMMAA